MNINQDEIVISDSDAQYLHDFAEANGISEHEALTRGLRLLGMQLSLIENKKHSNGCITQAG